MQGMKLLLLSICVWFTVPLAEATNPPTSVMNLNEKFLEVMNDGFWIVKFYAPWCAHCKRIAPIWEHIAHSIQDKNLPVHVAKVDCTRFPSVCTTIDIHGYPTIIFFRQGRRVEYHGERTKEAILSFIIKSSSAVIENANAVRLNELRSECRNDPCFMMIKSNELEDPLVSQFEAAADSLFSKTRFFIVNPESAPAPLKEKNARIAVIKDDTIFPYESSSGPLNEWVTKERWPMFPRMSPSNIADISTSGKLIVVVATTELDRLNKSSDVGIFYDKAAKAAQLMRKAEHLWDQYQFVWIDGADIITSVTMSAVDAPAIIVFNYTSYEFYNNDDATSQITPSSLLTWLENLSDGIQKGTIHPQGGRALTTRMRRMIFEVYSNISQMFHTQPLLSSCLFGVPIGFLSIICYSLCSADFSVDREEFYPDEDEEDMDEEEQPEDYVADPDHQKNE